MKVLRNKTEKLPKSIYGHLKIPNILTVVDVAYHVYLTCVCMHSLKLDMYINLFLAFKKTFCAKKIYG